MRCRRDQPVTRDRQARRQAPGNPSPSPGSWPSRERPRLRSRQRQGTRGRLFRRRSSPIAAPPSTPARIPLPRFLCPNPRPAPMLSGARGRDARVGKGIGARECTLSRRQSGPCPRVRSAGGQSLPRAEGSLACLSWCAGPHRVEPLGRGEPPPRCSARGRAPLRITFYPSIVPSSSSRQTTARAQCRHCFVRSPLGRRA